MSIAALLSPFQETLVRSAFNGSVRIVGAYHLHALQPSPLLVDMVVDGNNIAVVLRIARNDGGVEREASIYPTLRALGLPVPTVLAGPSRDPEAPELFAMTVIERLEGHTLADYAGKSGAGLRLATMLFGEAYVRLRETTARAQLTPGLATLPRRSLRHELQDVISRGGGWTHQTEVKDAIARLRTSVDQADSTLMLSNGDFSPANLLSDGVRLTGMIDFEKAAFVDPLMVLTRVPVYDMRPLSACGVVDNIVTSGGYSRSDFALRVAVFCLRTLQTKVPVQDTTPSRQPFRRHVLSVLNTALGELQ